MGHAQGAAVQHGRIKSFNSEKGFGFIECAATFAQFGRDVFLHKAQVGDMRVGTMVTFTYEVNKQGMPQAKEVREGFMMGLPGGKFGGKGKGKGEKGKGKGEKGKAKGEGKGKAKDKDKDGKQKEKERDKGDKKDKTEKDAKDA